MRRLLAFVPLLAISFADPAAAIGILVPSQPNMAAVQLKHHRVEVDINERGATTKVTQTFHNSTGRQLEATYLFPLPKGATVDEYALWMNGKREVGKVMERNKARQIYESIVRRARDPGLIEYVDATLFQARVFPVPANGDMKIELIYTHLVPYEDGVHKYIYPMKTDQHASATLDDFTMTVRIKNKLPIKNLYSPTHAVATQRKGKTGAASFEKHTFSLQDDFALLWSVDDKDVGLTLLSYKPDPDKAGYYMLLASPKDGFRNKEIIGKRISFVVDTSGSMAGDKMNATKRALEYCVRQLGEDDLFNIVTFGGFVETFKEKMVSAGSSNKNQALKFVRAIEPLGGTNIDEALQTTMSIASGSAKVPHMVVFLTDGRPTVGETDVNNILKRANAKNNGHARIFVFGVGDDVNTSLLDKLADNNGGLSTYLAGDASMEGGLKRFYDRISHPVLSNLQLKVSGLRTFGELPRRLPDLFKGSQLVVLGRYRSGGKATVKLTGSTPRGSKTFSYKADFAKGATDDAFIARLWAQRQVGVLLAEIRDKGESKALVDEVTQLATAFGIVTPYTSYLVVEPGFVAPPPRPDMPRPRPRPMPRRAPADDADMGAFAPSPAEMDFEEAPATSGAGGRGSGLRAAKSKGARKKLEAKEGGEAVAAAREIGRLKDSSVADKRRASTSTVRAMGRDFRFQNGGFVDAKVKKGHKRLKVKTYSKAFFEVLRLRPDLKAALKLGEKVTVWVGGNRVLVVTPDGAETVSKSKLKAFLK
jgi:Ca-activated chloride channel family protein